MNINFQWSVFAFAIGLSFWACDDSSSSSTSLDDDGFVETSSSEKATPESSAKADVKSSSSAKKENEESSSAKAESVVSSSEEQSETPSSSSKKTETRSSSSAVPQYPVIDTLYSGRFEFVRKNECALLAEEHTVSTASFFTENGETKLKVENMRGDCLDSAAYAMSRVGDTLIVFWNENNPLANCVCISDHVFKVSMADTDAKVVKYVSWWDENWHEFNVSEISSGSMSAEPSSSSEEIVAMAPIQLGKCINHLDDKAQVLMKANLEEVVATITPKDGAYELMIPDVSDYCEVEAEVIYRLVNDTLYVSYGEIGMATKCLCNADHYFKIGSEFTGAKYTAFGGQVFKIKEN